MGLMVRLAILLVAMMLLRAMSSTVCLTGVLRLPRRSILLILPQLLVLGLRLVHRRVLAMTTTGLPGEDVLSLPFALRPKPNT